MKVYLVCMPSDTGYPVEGIYGSLIAAKRAGVELAKIYGYDVDDWTYRYTNDMLYARNGNATPIYLVAETVYRGRQS